MNTPEDLGTLYAIELKFNNSMENDILALDLTKIEIYVDDLKFFFHFDNFINVENYNSNINDNQKVILFEQYAEFD